MYSDNTSYISSTEQTRTQLPNVTTISNALRPQYSFADVTVIDIYNQPQTIFPYIIHNNSGAVLLLLSVKQSYGLMVGLIVIHFDSNIIIYDKYMNKNILEIICEMMILAQRSKIAITDKKQFVMSVLKLHITDFERYEPIINLVIEKVLEERSV